MAKVGQVITNPITRERITFQRTTVETDGQTLVFECEVAPGGTPLPAHVHTAQMERFEVISGTLGIMCGRETRILSPGQRATLPPGIKHQWWNAASSVVRFRVVVVPAGRLERVLEVISAMEHHDRMNAQGMPKNIFELANLARLSDTHVPGFPVFLQRLGVLSVSALGCLLGYPPGLSGYRTSLLLPDSAVSRTEDRVA